MFSSFLYCRHILNQRQTLIVHIAWQCLFWPNILSKRNLMARIILVFCYILKTFGFAIKRWLLDNRSEFQFLAEPQGIARGGWYPLQSQWEEWYPPWNKRESNILPQGKRGKRLLLQCKRRSDILNKERRSSDVLNTSVMSSVVPGGVETYKVEKGYWTMFMVRLGGSMTSCLGQRVRQAKQWGGVTSSEMPGG